MSPRSTISQGKTTQAATTKRAAKTAPVARKPATKTGAPARRKLPAAGPTPDQRQQFIAEAAYFRAEQRGFALGGELDDWLEAEAQIDAALGSQAQGTSWG